MRTPQFKIGLEDDLKGLLERAAEEHGVSLADEIRRRLWWSLSDGGTLSDPIENLKYLSAWANG